MSREIKFRAWNPVKEKFWDGNGQPIAVGGGKVVDGGDWQGWYYNQECDYIIEQYTGLKDKNGKEIYEGDIVKIPDWQVKPKYEKVRFAKLSCGFEPFVCGCFECIAPDGEEVEVIGNIHENPELLEDK